ncbi:MAG: hypothetical protein ACFNVY_06510, partial [Actinomyces oris]
MGSTAANTAGAQPIPEAGNPRDGAGIAAACTTSHLPTPPTPSPPADAAPLLPTPVDLLPPAAGDIPRGRVRAVPAGDTLRVRG